MNATPIPDAALEHHLAILGKTGSGKSNAAKIVAEVLLTRGERICAIDPTGTWWGLRLDAKGKKSSPWPIVIFGGEHADLPLGPEHGAAIAEAIGTSSTPAIIDTRLMTVAARTKFFTGFAQGLLRANRGPLTLIVDEAHLFAPQGRVADPRSGEMLHAANNLVSLGRGVGLRVILISQRPAKLHKDSLTQVETLVAMRVIAPQDRRAIEDWIGEWADPKEGRELVQSMASLPKGDAWIWSPELGVLKRDHFPLVTTFDSGRPRSGEGVALKPIDVKTIAARLEEVAADAFANDPGRLKARLAQAERELQKAQRNITGNITAPDPKAIEAAEQRGYDRGRAEGFNEGQASGFEAARQAAQAAVEGLKAPAGSPVPTRRAPPPAPRPVAAAPKPAAREAPKTNGSHLSGPQQRIVDAIAWWNALGFASPSRVQVAFVAGYKPNTGTFNTYLGALSTGGILAYPAPGKIALTDEGRAQANDPGAPTLEELRERVAGVLSGPQNRILASLYEAWPESLTRNALAERSGYQPNTGTFNTYLGSLSTLGIIDYPNRGMVQPAEWLFA